MILSFQIPAVVAYRKVAIDLYEVERDIAKRERSRHEIDQKILPQLIAKRERLLAEAAPLKAEADKAEATALQQYLAPRTDAATPAPRAIAADGNLDIPDFLRRVPA